MEIYPILKEVYKTLSKDNSSDSIYALYFHSLRELIKDKQRVTFLNDEDRLRLTEDDKQMPSFKTELKGYPSSPIYSAIANNLVILTLEGTCPIYHQPFLAHLNEHNNSIYRIDRIKRVVDLLKPIPSMLKYWNCERFLSRFEIILNILRKRGMLDLLQLRKTVGSSNVFPFSREAIHRSAEALHNPSSSLTVAGRAVAKHAVRDSTKAWWGECTGTEAQKNEKGKILVDRVLDSAIWINIHGLPGELPALEIRNEQGYGLRCLVNPLSFRGFLEPYKLEGWLDKFSH